MIQRSMDSDVAKRFIMLLYSFCDASKWPETV
jgi:hypothetical protein